MRNRLFFLLVVAIMMLIMPAIVYPFEIEKYEKNTQRIRDSRLSVVVAQAQQSKPEKSSAQQKAGSEKTEQRPGVPAENSLKKQKPLMPLSPEEDELPLDGDSLPPPPPGFREVTMDEASAIKPPLNILDLHGYLRLRADLNHGVNLSLSEREPYPHFPGSASGRTKTLSMANMRFRLEPTINISEDVRIMSQIDMLDNLILGSTPNGYPTNPYYPVVALSQEQVPPTQGLNSLSDSILVKRVWGEVMTPVGLLRFGRMGSHWGLGLMYNDGGPAYLDRGPLVTQMDPFSPTGQCFDCDYGSTVDRVMFITKIGGHYVVPMIDFTGEGPYFSSTNGLSGQPWDADQLDDVNTYGVAVTKRDKPEDVKDALDRGEWVLNYGLYFVYRNQSLDAVAYHSEPNANDPSSFDNIEDYAVRDYEAYIPDVWVRFQKGKLRLELELMAVLGRLGYTSLEPSLDEEGNIIPELAEEEASLAQFGGVLQADYLLMDDQIILGLEIGYASGDNSPGFGVRPFEEDQFNHAEGDHDINNLRFHPDYHMDLILWRQIIGTVTDALYLKPSFQYNIAEGVGTKLSAVYSSAVYPSSTRGKNSPLGVELDADFFYFSGDKFHAGLSYGFLVPFSGMDDLGDDGAPGGTGDDADKGAEVAHRIMARLVLYF